MNAPEIIKRVDEPTLTELSHAGRVGVRMPHRNAAIDIEMAKKYPRSFSSAEKVE